MIMIQNSWHPFEWMNNCLTFSQKYQYSNKQICTSLLQCNDFRNFDVYVNSSNLENFSGSRLSNNKSYTKHTVSQLSKTIQLVSEASAWNLVVLTNKIKIDIDCKLMK